VVIGADGRESLVASTMRPEQYNEKPRLLCGYYSYWSGVPMNGRFETYIRPRRGLAAAPTNDGLTLIIAGWPNAEFEANKKDVEGHYLATLALAGGEFAERLQAGRRETRIAGATIPNFFRRPYGPGWVLVGDAGYNKDPITAQGITDAFHDAERVTGALNEAFTGGRTFEDAMEASRRARDEHAMPMYEFTCQLATLEPPPPEMQQIFGAIHGNAEATRRFVQMNAGTISPAEFFAPESIGAIMASAAGARRTDTQPPTTDR
jgi:2-polyprenyl-6-methoxyphenol hydroxylase-like FAD-dependent oxidoreductase